MDLNQNFTSLDDAALVAYATEVRAALDALVALGDDATIEQITEGETLADHLDAIAAHQEAQVAAEAERVTRAAALRERFSTEPPEGEETEEAAEDEGDEEADGDEADEEAAPEAEASVETAPAARAAVATLARRTTRPKKPARTPVTITAAADVPEFATGSRIETMDVVGKALVNRMRGFGHPSGDG